VGCSSDNAMTAGLQLHIMSGCLGGHFGVVHCLRRSCTGCESYWLEVLQSAGGCLADKMLCYRKVRRFPEERRCGRSKAEAFDGSRSRVANQWELYTCTYLGSSGPIRASTPP
jgi:hypothetical protein